jgi:hypothetical protein
MWAQSVSEYHSKEEKVLKSYVISSIEDKSETEKMIHTPIKYDVNGKIFTEDISFIAAWEGNSWKIWWNKK